MTPGVTLSSSQGSWRPRSQVMACKTSRPPGHPRLRNTPGTFQRRVPRLLDGNPSIVARVASESHAEVDQSEGRDHVQDRLADEVDEGGTAALQDQESCRHAGQERTGGEHQRMKVPPTWPMNPAVD